MSKKNKERKDKKRKLTRKEKAKRWLSGIPLPDDLIKAYSQKFNVEASTAYNELMEIGYYDELYIQEYKRRGIEWEYKVEPLSGDMFVVPKGTADHELYEIHPIL